MDHLFKVFLANIMIFYLILDKIVRICNEILAPEDFKGQLLVDDHGWRENLASRKERPMVKMKE